MVELRKASAFDYLRFVLSALLLLFSAVVTSYAIVEKKTSFWQIVPGWVALILFVLDLFWLGVVEGLQIALVELKRQHPESYRRSHPLAFRLGQVASRGDNVERFLMGRQVFVVFLVFFAAKLTTIHQDSDSGFLFPTPAWFRAVFLETGILACLVVVIVAQLMPQILAAKYPVHFLQICIMRPAYYACIALEFTGLTHICWVLSDLLGWMFGMTDDETTKNPVTGHSYDDIVHVSDVIQDVEAAFERSDCSESSDGETNKKTSSLSSFLELSPINEEFSQFSNAVEKINRQVSPDLLKILRHYLDSHPEKFNKFPSVVGGKMYPSPKSIADNISSHGHEIPRFLMDVSHPDHIPPHIVACEMMAKNKYLEREIEMLQRKLNYA